MKKICTLAAALLAALLCVLPLASCAENDKVKLDDAYELKELTIEQKDDTGRVVETFTFEEGEGDTAILTGYECAAIKDKEVMVPKMYNDRKVTVIGATAFYNLSAVTRVVLPDSVERVEEIAFANCKNLVTVEVGSALTEIGDGAFLGCSSLKNLVGVDKSALATIGERAFWECEALNFQLPATVVDVGNAAFWNCKALTQVVFSDAARTIGNLAFYNCTGIQTIRLNNNMESIGEYAFVLEDESTLKDKIDLTGVTNQTIIDYVESIKDSTTENEDESKVETEPVESETETEPVTEPETEVETETETEVETETETEAETEIETEAETETEAEAEAEAETEPVESETAEA